MVVLDKKEENWVKGKRVLRGKKNRGQGGSEKSEINFGFWFVGQASLILYKKYVVKKYCFYLIKRAPK